MSETGESSTWTSSDGLSLFFREYRSHALVAGRAPIVCVPGLTRNSDDFAVLGAHLAGRGWRVLTPDLRGRGRSAWDPDKRRYNPRTYARDMHELLGHLRLDAAIFIGTSLGGLVTMELAASRPQVVAAAVLNDIGPQVAEAGVRRIQSYAGQRVAITNWQEAAAYVQRICADAFPTYGAADWEIAARAVFREEADGRLVLNYDPAAVPKFPMWLLRLLRPLLWARFRRFASARPVLLVRGALSDIIDVAIAERMRRTAPRMDYAEIQDRGHAPTLTEPRSIAAIERFLERVADGR